MSLMGKATTDCLFYLPAKSYGLDKDMLPVSLYHVNVPETLTADCWIIPPPAQQTLILMRMVLSV